MARVLSMRSINDVYLTKDVLTILFRMEMIFFLYFTDNAITKHWWLVIGYLLIFHRWIFFNDDRNTFPFSIVGNGNNRRENQHDKDPRTNLYLFQTSFYAVYSFETKCLNRIRCPVSTIGIALRMRFELTWAPFTWAPRISPPTRSMYRKNEINVMSKPSSDFITPMGRWEGLVLSSPKPEISNLRWQHDNH